MTAINKCQYWSEYEPSQCSYWNDEKKICDFKEEQLNDPSRAPYCNHLGTAYSCNHYIKSDISELYCPRCILPDETRHVCNRATGEKWVTASGIAKDEEGENQTSDSGYTIIDWDFAPINGYNNGECNELGTDTTCSGYAPQHMGFGRLVPTSDEEFDTFSDGKFSAIKDFDSRLPTNFVVYNIRASLSKCYWWTTEYTKFTISKTTSLVELGGVWSCNNTNDVSMYSQFSEEYGAPCNGCKPECPYYTGVCWEYCTDDLTQSGDPILAEQIHELRYYHKENQWTVEKINSYFIDGGNIFAWDGVITDNKDVLKLKGNLAYTVNAEGQIEEYQIPAQQTYMESFDVLDILRDHLVLTTGTEVNGQLVNFPTLVKEIKTLSLDPIIKNRFSSFNVFESSLLADSTILIYGKVFYEAPTYAINISDSEVASVLPYELFYYDSLLSIEIDLGKSAYDLFYTKYESVLKALLCIMPDKIIANELPETNSSFMMKVPIYYAGDTCTSTNQNTILVFQKTPKDGWLFSKVSFEKGFVGGILLQNSFTLEGDGKSTRTPFDYTKGLNAHVNKNGSMSFAFSPITSGDFTPQPDYMYNDLYLRQEIAPGSFSEADPTVYLGCKLYEVVAEEYVLQDGANGGPVEFTFLGEDGYLLITLEHPRINNVFMPWEFDEILITFSGEVTTTCEMELVYHGSTELLGAQQLLVKPKNIDDFRSTCGAWITIKNLKYWEKRSYDQEPDIIGNWVSTLFEPEGITSNYAKDTADFSEESGTYTLSNFQFTMVPSVVIKNREGKPFTQYRTKAIGWVKQPYCPDVEIRYDWSANYIKWDNYPVCMCCGPADKRNAAPSSSAYSPRCGDHDINMFSKTGPMWWPYTSCESYAKYDIISNLSNYSLDVIGLFKETDDDENKIHGDHDMRMLGPSQHEAFHGRGCNFLVRCTCDWRTFNKVKNGENYFTGYARVRGRVSGATLSEWVNEEEVLPKFGNVNRPQLNSYRTIDKWQYLSSSDGGDTWNVSWLVMPATMQFNKVDFTSVEESMWDFGASEDGPNVNNPMGMFLSPSIEGIPIGESIDQFNRFNFDEVFHCRVTTDLIRYPATKGSYVSTRKGGQIYPWYEFKEYPVGDSFDQIQWAWQELWKPIERNTNPDNPNKVGAFREFIIEYLQKDSFSSIKGPFIEGSNNTTGTLSFLDVENPNYKYNYKNQELRLTVAEGGHFISMIAPEKNPYTGEYTGFIKIALDSGAERGITWEGVWATEADIIDNDLQLEEYNIELYRDCIGGEDNPPETVGKLITAWSPDVTLFGTNYNDDSSSTAEDDDRMIQSYIVEDDVEFTKKTCFQRGLKVNPNNYILSGASLPLQLVIIDQMQPLEIMLEGIVGLDETLTSNITFDYIKKTVGSISFSFNFGLLEATPPTATTSGVYEMHHIPKISIYASDDGVAETRELFSTESMELCLDQNKELEVVERVFSWDNALDYIGGGKEGILIKYRITPTTEELAELTETELKKYSSVLNKVVLLNAQIYEEVLTDATEQLVTWERKYLVSHGGSGDAPPQGNDITKPVYQPKPNHKSTYFQNDTDSGVLNIDGSSNEIKMASKVYSRQLYTIYEDKEVLDGDVHQLEAKQKILYDEALVDNHVDDLMIAAMPPGLDTILNNAQLSYSPGAVLIFSNTIIAPLAKINHFPMMSGQGHEYAPSKPSKTGCDEQLPCGVLEDAVFYYSFNSKDAGGGALTGVSHASALDTFYTGTATMLLRREIVAALTSGVFGRLYGASTETNIWADEEDTYMLFYNLDPLSSVDTSVSPVFIDWNLNHFAVSGHWNNAYFNTQKYEPTNN